MHGYTTKTKREVNKNMNDIANHQPTEDVSSLKLLRIIAVDFLSACVLCDKT